jgi:hypothetical protein
VKSKLQVVEVVEAKEVSGVQLPEHVQLSLAGIAGQAKEGLLALAVSTGLAVLHETMECEVERIAGPKGRHDRERTAKRHGHTPGEVTLGARRVPISRPRVRTADDTDVERSSISAREGVPALFTVGMRTRGADGDGCRRSAACGMSPTPSPPSRPRHDLEGSWRREGTTDS